MTRALLPSLLVVFAAWAASAPAASAAPRVTADPNPVPFGEKQTVKGRGWPVIEFCSRTVRLSLRSDQNAFRIGTDRVGLEGRFRFTWVPRRREVGRGDWTLVARMRCESGKDGSPNPVRATTPIRIGASNVVVAAAGPPRAGGCSTRTAPALQDSASECRQGPRAGKGSRRAARAAEEGCATCR